MSHGLRGTCRFNLSVSYNDAHSQLLTDVTGGSTGVRSWTVGDQGRRNSQSVTLSAQGFPLPK